MNHTASVNNNTNFIKRVWNGDLSLAKTFWLLVVIGQFLIFWLLGMGWDIMEHASSPSVQVNAAAFTLIVYLCLIPYQVWTMIGLWRSASPVKYDGWAVWRTLARSFVILNTFEVINSVLSIGFMVMTIVHAA